MKRMLNIKGWLGIAGCLMLCVSQAQAKTETRPQIPVLSAAQIESSCAQHIEAFGKTVKKLEVIPTHLEDESARFMREWNRFQAEVEDVQGPLELLSQVSPDRAVREKAADCAVRIRKFATDLFQNELLYKRARQVRTSDDVDRKWRRDLVDAFEDTGVSLHAKKRERAKQILNRLSEISQGFSKNVRDNPTRLTFTAAEMQGLPAAYLEAQKSQRDASGNYALGFSYPEYIPFMQYAQNAEARKRYMQAFTNRGTPANLALLQEAATLRLELAALFGYRSYADYVLRRRMALKPGNVDQFLEEVSVAIAEAEKQEIEVLRALKSRLTGTPLEKTVLARWDVSYYQQKLKQERYQLDQEALRQYFPTQAVLPWAMQLFSRLYDIRFTPVSVPVWHPDVQYFDVLDNKTGALLGGIYVDMYPREGKYGHAAAFGVRGSSTLEQRLPVSVLVANFNRKGLDATELETLMHEFGHVMHGVLSKTRYVDQSGTSVERDFVEAPSQMLENWARDPHTLAMVAQYCQGSCPQVDKALADRMQAARAFGRGMQYGRQLLYAKYDMALHSDNPKKVMQLWKDMEKATSLGYVEGTEFPGQFGHLAGGYAAGYYGYLWAEVLAWDMLSRFNGDLLNKQVGQRYRSTILERGSELPAERLVRHFLGREPDSKAFYREITGANRKQ